MNTELSPEEVTVDVVNFWNIQLSKLSYSKSELVYECVCGGHFLNTSSFLSHKCSQSVGLLVAMSL